MATQAAVDRWPAHRTGPVAEALNKYVPLLGRLLLSQIFILSGISKLMNWSGTEAYMAAQGMPLVPLLLLGATVVEILGGLSLLLGWQARWGAFIVFLYLIPTTLIFHNFWAYHGAEQQMQMINFMKNLAIMGGLLMMAANGPGLWSVDERCCRGR